MIDFMKLQNGSDIRGIAMDGVEGEEVNLTPEAAGAIGGAFAYWLGFKAGKNPYDLRIAVGHDSRLSAGPLTEALLKGMTMFGAECYDAGLASTPAMFMSTVLPQLDFDGAVMITASHLPWNRNGFKFFTKEGGLDKEDITEILKRAAKYNFVGEFYEERETNVLQMYAAYLRQMISLGLKDVPGGLNGMHILVDAGNGAGGFFV
ncbi:MAG: phosphomannomutase/phosphoglucomutase, partial [Mogibacterium sp.]|nr:phosphomannomutase/phosphoglucomutase [Mogibacterium sp.]